MSSRGKSYRSKRKSRFAPYNKETTGIEDMTKSDLVKQLFNIGIKVPTDLSLNILKKLYRENIGNKSVSVDDSEDILRADSSDVAVMNSTNDNAERQETLQQIPQITTSAPDSMTMMMTAFNTVSKCVVGLQDTVNSLVKEKTNDANRNFSLHQWYSGSNETTPSAQQDSLDNGFNRAGIRSDDFPNVDIVSGSIQKQIIQGKDVNLASLLIPKFESPQSHSVTSDGIEFNVTGKPDPRLNRQLTIQEFILAFGKYKRVMNTAFPGRRSELDAYEEDIIEISNFYGQKFYDYHKLFSAKAATLLQDKHIKVDWSKRDRDLLSLIGAGVDINVCKLCNMIDHSSKFCPLQLAGKNRNEVMSAQTGQSGLRYVNQTTDKRGRNRSFHNGREICNNFNTSDGCKHFGRCTFLHICLKCRSSDHGQHTCPQTTTQAVPAKSTTLKSNVANSGNLAAKRNPTTEK